MVIVTKFEPRWAMPTALTAHRDRTMFAPARAAVEFILDHLQPRSFFRHPHLSAGKLTRRRATDDHPAGYERLVSIVENKKEAV